MEIWQLALLAAEGLKLLFILAGGGAEMMKPSGPATTCEREIIQRRVAGDDRAAMASCRQDTMTFSLPDPDAHWMVRR